MADTELTIPDSWSALAKSLGVPQPSVSLAVRVILSTRGPVPDVVPPPKILGREIVNKVIESLTLKKTCTTRKDAIVAVKIDIKKRIRQLLDENLKLLGHGLIETVADELGVSLEEVAEVLKKGHEALKLEKKILSELKADEAAEQAARQARESEAARQAQAAAEAARPRPKAPPPAPLLAESGETRQRGAKAPPVDPRSVRPDCFPQRGENLSLDETLRAAWIAIKGGAPNVPAAVLRAVQDECTEAELADVEKAIEASYWERPEASRKQMERRAEKMREESRG